MEIDNSVVNVIKLVGPTKSISRAMGELIIEDNIFTFDSFLPMPTELMGTDPSQSIIKNEEYHEILLDYKDRLDNGDLDMHEPVPMSEDIQKRFILTYGYDNWYDWSMNNWGVKWGPYETEVISDSKFLFYTANATPHSAMVKMSMKYPDIEFRVQYADEDLGFNVGEYTLVNGETIYTKVHKEFTVESFMMAYKLIADDYYIEELIYDLHPEEVDKAISGDDKILHTTLNVILELEVVDGGYAFEINQYLLETAVTNEQYEYAAKLKELMDEQVADY